MIHDILILPDIHGRTFWKDAVEHEQFATIIFLGDYLDPYPSEGINDEQALANFMEIIDYGMSHDNVVLLLGNHDMHYYSHLFAKNAMSSRFCFAMITELNELFTRHKNMFRNDITNSTKRQYKLTLAPTCGTSFFADLHGDLR